MSELSPDITALTQDAQDPNILALGEIGYDRRPLEWNGSQALLDVVSWLTLIRKAYEPIAAVANSLNIAVGRFRTRSFNNPPEDGA